MSGAPRGRSEAVTPTASLRSLTCFVLGAMLSGLALPAGAQSVRGRTLDEHRQTPVAGALVQLLDQSGKKRVEALADSLGRFALDLPKDGDYYLVASRIGYELTRSPLLALSAGGIPPVDLMMTPRPVGLRGLDVKAEASTYAKDQLRLTGIRPGDLGNNFIDRNFIESIAIKRDVGEILQWRGVGGLTVYRPENHGQPPPARPGDPPGLCFSFQRGRTATGSPRCALGVVNGLPVSNEELLLLDPQAIDAIAVLSPIDARILFGQNGDPGAVMFWTKRGGGG